MGACCWMVVNSCFTNGTRIGFCSMASADDDDALLHNHGKDQQQQQRNRKKVVVIGSDWAGLASAHHLCKQGFSVTVLEQAKNKPNTSGGIHGFLYPYGNIFSLVDEIGIKPFTNWASSAHYSPEGLEFHYGVVNYKKTCLNPWGLSFVCTESAIIQGPEVEYPIFQDLAQLPTPLGALIYTQFLRLSLVDRLTSLPLMAAVIDFDNTDTAWKKYDSMTARELFKQFGCSQRLYQDAFNPMVQVGLFAPAEQCSAAATLGMLYYFILAHQKDFDVVWCRGTVGEKIFMPWMDFMRDKGCEFLEGSMVTDFSVNEETGCISEVVCGKDTYEADAIILAVGISSLQEIIMNSSALRTREDFLKALNLDSIDVLTVRLRLDRKVNIPKASNVCFGFDYSYGWTFFDLNAIYDEYKDDPCTVIEANFYHANELLPLKDEQIVAKVISYVSQFIKDFKDANVVEGEVGRFPKSLSHFFPGSYKYMMRGSTSFPNLFMAGDWIITRHGSWAQEKAYVTGLEAANRVVDHLEEGSFAKIKAVEEEEPHIQALRSLNRSINEIRSQFPLSDYFL